MNYKSVFFYSICLGIFACTSTPKESLQEIPEICRFVDFSKDPEMAKICGIRETRYAGLKNIPPMRFLTTPKGGYLVLLQDQIELRLPQAGSIPLGDTQSIQIDFSKSAKTSFIKNKYEYFEIFPQDKERLRLFKIEIPTNNNFLQTYCFEIPSIITDTRLKSIGGTQINLIECSHLSEELKKDSLSHLTLLNPSPKSNIDLSNSKKQTPRQKLNSKRK